MLSLQTRAGLYLDLDIECFQPADPWLADYDVVLQVGSMGAVIGMLRRNS